MINETGKYSLAKRSYKLTETVFNCDSGSFNTFKVELKVDNYIFVSQNDWYFLVHLCGDDFYWFMYKEWGFEDGRCGGVIPDNILFIYKMMKAGGNRFA
jgi:hypothetical protein